MKFCNYIIPNGPARGLRCGAPLIATCDRSKPSELVEVRGIEGTKKNPQKMWLFPTAEEQIDRCFWHQRKHTEDKVGRETEI